MKLSKQNIKPAGNRGVTLIELLVVVAIISVLTAIMIPRLRVINKDRNIREAARVVGSTLAKVTNRAVDEGVAGLIIERNNNFVDSDGVYFAGTRMYAMRKLPPYSGDDVGSLATVFPGVRIARFPGPPGEPPGETQAMAITIPMPLERVAPNNLFVNQYDLVRLNHSSVLYRVDSPPIIGSGDTLGILLRLESGISGAGGGIIRPRLADEAEVPYVVYRQPRKLESSRVDLPDGYYIDLRYSGPFGTGGSVFNQATPADDNIQLFFAGDGSIDRYAYTDSSSKRQSKIPTDAFYFFVSAYDPDTATLPMFDPNAPIFSPSAMWVTVDKSTGSVNVAYNTPPPTGLSAAEQIQYARGISKARQSANQ